LDETIFFNALPLEIVVQIVGKFIRELEGQLAARKITFDVSREAQQWLAKKGFDAVYGARPMGRLIQREIKDPLADEILFGALKQGGKVIVGLENDKLVFSGY
jgi:ATP-dependent Clp protease ATP-binding subunit ClpA